MAVGNTRRRSAGCGRTSGGWRRTSWQYRRCSRNLRADRLLIVSELIVLYALLTERMRCGRSLRFASCPRRILESASMIKRPSYLGLRELLILKGVRFIRPYGATIKAGRSEHRATRKLVALLCSSLSSEERRRDDRRNTSGTTHTPFLLVTTWYACSAFSTNPWRPQNPSSKPRRAWRRGLSPTEVASTLSTVSTDLLQLDNGKPLLRP